MQVLGMRCVKLTNRIVWGKYLYWHMFALYK